ncbi:MAG: hypothetical protein R3D05_17010 [Dongiaceae bacterium]
MAELITNGSFDNLTADLLAHSNGFTSVVDMKAGLINLQPFWSKAGALHSHEHIAETKYGEAFVRHWYLFVYDLGTLFVRCTMYRPGDNWLFLDMSYADKPEDTGLTH